MLQDFRVNVVLLDQKVQPDDEVRLVQLADQEMTDDQDPWVHKVQWAQWDHQVKLV